MVQLLHPSNFSASYPAPHSLCTRLFGGLSAPQLFSSLSDIHAVPFLGLLCFLFLTGMTLSYPSCLDLYRISSTGPQQITTLSKYTGSSCFLFLSLNCIAFFWSISQFVIKICRMISLGIFPLPTYHLVGIISILFNSWVSSAQNKAKCKHSKIDWLHTYGVQGNRLCIEVI